MGPVLQVMKGPTDKQRRAQEQHSPTLMCPSGLLRGHWSRQGLSHCRGWHSQTTGTCASRQE